MSQERENSTVVSTLSEWADGIDAAASRSRVAAAVGALGQWTDGIGAAAANSRLSAGADALGRWAGGSYVVRWLTAEPDPDVIVIDLRETYTVGPVLAGLDVAVRAVGRTRTARVASRKAAAAAEAVARRPVRIASAVALVALFANAVVSLALGGLAASAIGVRLLLAGPLLVGLRSTRTAADLRESWLWKLLEPPELPEERDAGGSDAGCRETDGRESESGNADDREGGAADGSGEGGERATRR